jgi:hypothetical protein
LFTTVGLEGPARVFEIKARVGEADIAYRPQPP